MNVLALQPVVVVEPCRIDEGDIAFAVAGDDFFAAGLDLVGKFGKARTRLCEWNDILGGESDDWLL